MVKQQLSSILLALFGAASVIGGLSYWYMFGAVSLADVKMFSVVATVLFSPTMFGIGVNLAEGRDRSTAEVVAWNSGFIALGLYTFALFSILS